MKVMLSAVLGLFTFLYSFSQSNCYNLDFEDLDTSNWVLSIGNGCSVSTNCYSQTSIGTNVGAIGWAKRHARTDTSYQDISIPSIDGLCPFTGSSSIRLGDNLAGLKAERMEITVDANNLTDTMIFYYAYVSNDGGHGPNDNAFFEFVIEYTNSTVVKLDTILYLSSGDTSLSSQSLVKYKNWTAMPLDFRKYKGNITIRMTNSDCGTGGHSGRVYFDFEYKENTVSVKELSNSSGISMYPNPVVNELNISTKLSSTEIEILSAEGKLIRRIATGKGFTHTINVGDLDKGIYYLKLLKGKKRISNLEKFVKL